MNFISVFVNGLYRENAVFRLLIGLCPTLAITTTIVNSIGMGIAVIYVLVCSNLFISLVRKMVPNKIRIPIYIMTIATFVTMVELLMGAYDPALSKSLGIFVPLIVANCLPLARLEAFAAKNTVISSVADGFGMGIGYTLALVLIAVFRELLGNGTLFHLPIFPETYKPILVMVLAPGGFLTIGYLLGFFNWFDSVQKKERA
jgi:Na+-translocating ferredoxin:NAD+ oxidoreductase subunit E